MTTTNDKKEPWLVFLTSVYERALCGCADIYERQHVWYLYNAVVARRGADIDEYRALQKLAREAVAKDGAS